MSTCNFNIPVSEPVNIAIEKARTEIENQNGVFNGDENSGFFEVTIFGNTIKGNYNVVGQVLHLVITDKPFFVPCATIESFLLKQIN